MSARTVRWLWFASCVLCLSAARGEPEVQLSPGSVAAFASPEQGRTILGRMDEYLVRMGGFDRMLRMRMDRDVGPAEHREVLERNVTGWTDADRRKVATELETIAARLKGLHLPLPSRVWLVRTTGIGELGDAYTRANAIVLPAASITAAPELLQTLIAHELFHVMTRYDAHFREKAYRTIGFRMCEHVELPPVLAARRLTNPDALRNDAYIELNVGGNALKAIPVLLSRSETFDPKIGTELTDYWQMRLMVVEAVGGARQMAPVIENREPVLLEPAQVQGFFEQIGTNTDYIIHPEEILADHFALIATGARVREPRFIEALRSLLREPRAGSAR
jgi:hypothetical protein